MYFEIQIYFRLEDKDNSTYICNPFHTTSDERCPYVTFRQEKYIDEELDVTSRGEKAKVVVPNDNVGFNLIHGVFKVDETIYSLERL